mgnify:FL=1
MTDVDIAITSGVGADTYGYSGNPLLNYGVITTFGLSAGVAIRRPIIRFDLSSIPASAVCSAATLKITNSSNISGNTPISIYKISDANGDWIEGTKAAIVGAGMPCWSYKAYDTDAWAGSAGLSTAGTDYVNTVLASTTLTNGTAANTQNEISFNSDGLAVIQSWFGDATNNGFVLFTTNANSNGFHSKQSTTAGYRPILSITYTEAVSGVPKHFMHYQRLRSL